MLSAAAHGGHTSFGTPGACAPDAHSLAFQRLVEQTVEGFGEDEKRASTPEAVKDARLMNAQTRQDHDEIAYLCVQKSRELAELRNSIRLLDLEHKWVVTELMTRGGGGGVGGEKAVGVVGSAGASGGGVAGSQALAPAGGAGGGAGGDAGGSGAGGLTGGKEGGAAAGGGERITENSTTNDKVAFLRQEIDQTKNQGKVYLHMIERLKKELSLLGEKNGILDRHLKRKRNEANKKKEQVQLSARL